MDNNKNNTEQSGDSVLPETQNNENDNLTKKCPYCAEMLPQKIAFCLYCMKPLLGGATHTVFDPPPNNKSNPKRWPGFFIGAAAAVLVIAIITATSLITASVLSHQGRNHHDRRPFETQTPIPLPSHEPTHTQESTVPPPQDTPSHTSPPTSSPSGGQNNRPSNPAISRQRAIEIGYEELARRGYTGSFRNSSGMDWERGQWVWEIEFRVEGGRLPLVEMYINVDTGAVVKFEWDD